MTNYFTLLELEPSFEVNEADLQRAYVQMQQQYHPDRMIGKPDAERAAAIQTSMDLNEAYEALKSPLKRAQHLLFLQGIHVNGERDTVQPSPDLLMETMELRERLSEAKGEEALAALVKDIKQQSKDCSARLAKAFAQDDFDTAAQLTMRLRYLGKSQEEAMMLQYQQKAVS